MLAVGRVECYMGSRVAEIFMGISLMGGGLRLSVNVGEVDTRDQDSRIGWP